MSDFKSKLPDFNELTSMAGKFLKDIKTSVTEIIDDYKQKRDQQSAASDTTVKPTEAPQHHEQVSPTPENQQSEPRTKAKKAEKPAKE